MVLCCKIEFVYDSSGLSGFKYNREEYLYQKNIQGDIIAILNLDGEVIAEYRYDAWGNCEYDLASGIATANPFRYRGYYYDQETGLYFLQTRYYDPEVGRFISQDDVTYLDPEHINGLNLYAYCANNPVMNVDPTGTSWWSRFWKSVVKIFVAAVTVVALVSVAVLTAGTAVGVIALGAAVGGTLGFISGGITGAISAAANGGNILEGFANGALSGAVTGAISGAFAASPVGYMGQVLFNAALSGAEYLVSSAINGTKANWIDFGISVVTGGAAGFVGGKGVLNYSGNIMKPILRHQLIKSGLGAFQKVAVPIFKASIAGYFGNITKFVRYIFER